MKDTFKKTFAIRLCVTYFVLALLFMVSVLRVSVVAFTDFSDVYDEQSTVEIKVGDYRGGILDCNMLPLNNTEYTVVAAALPTSAAKAALSSVLTGKEKSRVMKLLKDNKPAVCFLDEQIECEGITCIKVPVRAGENTAAHHIVGCLDAQGNGSSGIECAYDEVLRSNEALVAKFAVDGKGRCLLGVAPTFNTSTGLNSNAVVTTIDINIQNAVKKASAGIERGAIVVCETKSGKIRAMLSLPDFSPDDIKSVLDDQNSPLVNRCLSPFSVGSVFKPAIAAAALENGLADTTVECTGGTFIENRFFACHKHDGHGIMDIKSALCQSCNCCFYDLADKLGADKIYTYAKNFTFGSKIKLGDNLFCAAGNIPTVNELVSLSDRANFGIGQGSILLSPVSLLNLYNAIANDGEYILPSVIESVVEDGRAKKYKRSAPTKAMETNTAKTLKEYLKDVAVSGTGTAAYSEKTAVAGKTATAQTGRKNSDGYEITNSWFCGFFPADNPKYTAVIMSDGAFKTSPAAVFKSICEGIS